MGKKQNKPINPLYSNWFPGALTCPPGPGAAPPGSCGRSSDPRVCRSGPRTRLPGARAEPRASRGPSAAARRWIGDLLAPAPHHLARSRRCTADSVAERSGLQAPSSESSGSSSPPEKTTDRCSLNIPLWTIWKLQWIIPILISYQVEVNYLWAANYLSYPWFRKTLTNVSELLRKLFHIFG